MRTYGFLIADKGDTSETEDGFQEEDVLIQDEIFKSRLASIKRVRFSISVDSSSSRCCFVISYVAPELSLGGGNSNA